MMKKYYEEMEDGSYVFCGEIERELENGGLVLKESVHIPETDRRFPAPENGDILSLHEMPFDKGGKHATGAAIYNGEYFVAEYEDE